MPNKFKLGGKGFATQEAKISHSIKFPETYNLLKVNSLSNCGLFELGYLKVPMEYGSLKDVSEKLSMVYPSAWSEVYNKEVVFSRIGTVTEEQNTLKSALLDLGWKEAGDFYNPNSRLTCTLMTYLKNKEDFKKEGVY